MGERKWLPYVSIRVNENTKKKLDFWSCKILVSRMENSINKCETGRVCDKRKWMPNVCKKNTKSEITIRFSDNGETELNVRST